LSVHLPVLSVLPPYRPKPPPLWFVTNGATTVGPVRTSLLLRGIAHGRVPAECRIRELTWRKWRALHEVREVRALKSPSSWNLTTAARTANLLLRASDRSERLLLGLQAAVAVTSASAGLIHRFGDSGPVIRYVHGDTTLGVLGQRLSPRDPALNAACQARMLLGSPEEGEAERSIWLRLTAGYRAFRGVAMVPLIHRSRLFGAIELGRSEHAFRAEDALELARLATVVAEQYAAY